MELLRSKGHEAALFSMADPRGLPTPYDRHFMPHIDFKKPSGWFHKAMLSAQAIYSREARRRIRAMIAEFPARHSPRRNIYHQPVPIDFMGAEGAESFLWFITWNSAIIARIRRRLRVNKLPAQRASLYETIHSLLEVMCGIKWRS